MKIFKLEDGLFEVVAPRMVDADQIHDDLVFLHQRGILTFGDLTTRLLYNDLTRMGHEVVLTDLCYEDDRSIGLQMPDTWYLNKGLYALSISMYFNFLNYKEIAKAGELYTRNRTVAEEFGRIVAVEVYIADDVLGTLDKDGKRYFGTPRTLTECMRVLEGWDLKRLPRLAHYVSFANFIQLWCSINFPGYNSAEWGLGKEASRKIFHETGTTNVRDGIRFFWENYLEKRPGRVAPEDIEIDVLDPEFHTKRAPRYVLIGEDIFDQESVDTGHKIVFQSFSESKLIYAPRRVTSNLKQRRTAELLRKAFPESTVVMFRNQAEMPSFTMMKFDEVKTGVSRELAVVARGLRQIYQMEGGNAKK